MTKAKWLLEKDVFDADLEPLLEEIKRQGYEFKMVDHMTSLSPEKVKVLFEPEDCVVFYGSLGLAQIVRRHAPWIPGVYCDLPKFECVYYYPRMGDVLLNNFYTMLPFGEMMRRKDYLLFNFADKDGKVFVRPSSPFKIFGGKVISGATWEADIKFLGFYDVEPERVVVVAPPKVITYEWRLVVVGDEVVSGSQYIRNDEIESGPCPDEVMAYGNSVLSKVSYRPEKAWCLDVCQTDDDKLHIMEVGAFSTCGLYQCPPEPIIRRISEVALEDWKEVNEEQT